MHPVTLCVTAGADAERPWRRSHAERGNDLLSPIPRQKKPRSSRDKIEAEVVSEELCAEGDQTVDTSAEAQCAQSSSLQVSRKRPVHRYRGHCDNSSLPPPIAPTRIEPRQCSLKKDSVMMHADL